MNKEILIKRLQNVSPKLKAELSYYMEDVEHDEIPDYDLSDAFDDYTTIIVDDNKMPVELKNIYIDIAYAVEIDISLVTVSHGKKYWFRHDGKHYQCVTSWEQWINN